MKKILKYSLLLFILLLIPITTVNAKTLGDIERELSASEKKLNDTNVQKAINKQDIDTTNKKISDIKKMYRDYSHLIYYDYRFYSEKEMLDKYYKKRGIC